jgi:hypothetical protein
VANEGNHDIHVLQGCNPFFWTQIKATLYCKMVATILDGHVNDIAMDFSIAIRWKIKYYIK